MPGFLYPRKESSRHLPHSQAFENSKAFEHSVARRPSPRSPRRIPSRQGSLFTRRSIPSTPTLQPQQQSSPQFLTLTLSPQASSSEYPQVLASTSSTPLTISSNINSTKTLDNPDDLKSDLTNDTPTTPGASNPSLTLSLYTKTMHNWTETQLHTSTDMSPTTLSQSSTTFKNKLDVTTVISPLYPTSSSLHLLGLSSGGGEGQGGSERSHGTSLGRRVTFGGGGGGDTPLSRGSNTNDKSGSDAESMSQGRERVGDALAGEENKTPCNTPKTRTLRRRSTVVVGQTRRVREELPKESQGQRRLKTVELVRSLSFE